MREKRLNSNKCGQPSSAKQSGKGKEKTVIKALALGGTGGGGGPCAVDVRDGRIIRTRPFHYDWKYKKRNSMPGNCGRTVRLLNRL